MKKNGTDATRRRHESPATATAPTATGPRRVLAVHLDRLGRALAREGVTMSRAQLQKVASEAFGFRTTNAASAAARDGSLTPPAATPVGEVWHASVRMLVARDPVTGLLYAFEPAGVDTGKRADEFGVTPYGTYVDAAGLEVELPVGPVSPGRTVHVAEITSGSRRMALLADDDVWSLREQVATTIIEHLLDEPFALGSAPFPREGAGEPAWVGAAIAQYLAQERADVTFHAPMVLMPATGRAGLADGGDATPARAETRVFAANVTYGNGHEGRGFAATSREGLDEVLAEHFAESMGVDVEEGDDASDVIRRYLEENPSDLINRIEADLVG